MVIISEQIDFPEDVSDLQAAYKVLSATCSISGSVQEYFLEALQKHHPQFANQHGFLGTLALHELLTNVSYHDHLNLHGEERERFHEDECLSRKERQYFELRVKQARGCLSQVYVRVLASKIRVEISLCREFATFEQRWQSAQETAHNPEGEASTKVTGRGLVIAAGFFDEANIDRQQQQLIFEKHL